MKKMNLAILGTGNIAAQMADTVSRMNNALSANGKKNL